MKNSKSGQATPKGGQAALLALFVMSVIVTVGMALISRTITDIQISETGEQGIRAFSAAEAGVEKVFTAGWDELAGWGAEESFSAGGSSGTIKLTSKTEIERSLKEGEVVFVKLDGANPTITGISGVELILYDGNDGYEKRAYGSCVANPTGTLGEINFNGANNVSIRILCADAPNFRISGGLPVQEYDIESKASALEGKTGAIEASRTVPAYPPMFDYVLFSGGSLGGE
jgi:hypothetical protein